MANAKTTVTKKVGKATVQVNMGAGTHGGIRRGVAAPMDMTMGDPKPKSATPGIPKVGK